jgi:hypothetical protein
MQHAQQDGKTTGNYTDHPGQTFLVSVAGRMISSIFAGMRLLAVDDIKPYIPVLNLTLNLTPRPRIVPGDFRAAGKDILG